MANGRNITIYDATTLAPQGSIDLPGVVVETVLSADGSTIFASNFTRDSVQLIDVKTKRVTREINVGVHPKILVLSRDGKTLYAANWNVPTTSLRYFTVYGPRQRPDMAFSRLISALVNGTEFEVYGDGSQSRDFTFITDAVAATIAAMRDAPAGATYNVGGGSESALRDVVAHGRLAFAAGFLGDRRDDGGRRQCRWSLGEGVRTSRLTWPPPERVARLRPRLLVALRFCVEARDRLGCH
jgi:YVTN family beta-propeller protein